MHVVYTYVAHNAPQMCACQDHFQELEGIYALCCLCASAPRVLFSASIFCCLSESFEKVTCL